MDGSLNFLRRLRDGNANRHARRRAAKQPPRRLRGSESGKAKRWLVMGLAVLSLIVGAVVAVIAATPTISGFSVDQPLYAPQVNGGRYQKGIGGLGRGNNTLRFRATITDATSPAAALLENSVQLLTGTNGVVPQSLYSTGGAANEVGRYDGNLFTSTAATLCYYPAGLSGHSIYGLTPGGVGLEGQDRYTARLQVTGGHTNDAQATATLEFGVGFTPRVLDVAINPIIGTEDSVYEFFIKIKDDDGEPLGRGGRCNVAGTAVTRLTGPAFGSATGPQVNDYILINGNWRQVASITNGNNLTLTTDAGTDPVNPGYSSWLNPNGYPKIWIRRQAVPLPVVNLQGRAGDNSAEMVPFDVDGTIDGERGVNIPWNHLTADDFRNGVWYRFAIPGPAIGAQLGLTPRLPEPGTGTGQGFYEFQIAYRDVDGIPNENASRTFNFDRDSSYPDASGGMGMYGMPNDSYTYGNWKAGPQIYRMEYSRGHFFPCTESGNPDTNGYLDTNGANPDLFNEGGVTVDPRDPQHDRQGTGSSTFTFRVRNRQSVNFGSVGTGAVGETLGFPLGGTPPAGNSILSWQNGHYDTWRDILRYLSNGHYPLSPSGGTTPTPMVIRFDENGDGNPDDGTPHFMQLAQQFSSTDGMWVYVVQPTDQQAANGGAGGAFANWGEGKTWDNNFECFLYGPLIDPAPFGVMTVGRQNPFGAGLPQNCNRANAWNNNSLSPGRLKFRYEMPRDIVVWNMRTTMTRNPDSDNPDTPYNPPWVYNPLRHGDPATAAGARLPITFDVAAMVSKNTGGAAGGGPEGRPYPAPPGPSTMWTSYGGITVTNLQTGATAPEQTDVGDLDTRLDTLKVDPVLRAEEGTRPDSYREIISLTTYAAQDHRTYDPSKAPTDPAYTSSTPIQIVDTYQLFSLARQTTAYNWPFRIQYIHSGKPADAQDNGGANYANGRPPLRVQVHILMKSGGNYAPIAGSPFNLVEEDSSDQNFKDGKWYRLNKTLPPGQYRYYYEASDGVRTTQWPGQRSDTGNGTSLAAMNVERSINTFRVNNAPTLSAPSVTPGTGPEDGQFTYSVTYQDLDGDQPIKSWLYIEEPAGSDTYKRVTMIPSGNVNWPYTGNVVYTYTTGTDFQLTPGTHKYYFAFVDNWNTTVEAVDGECTLLPATGRSAPFEGPTVVHNTAPQLTGGTVTDAAGNGTGTTATAFIYKVNYKDAENQPPAAIQVMVDPAVTATAPTTVSVDVNPLSPRVFRVASAAGAAPGKLAHFRTGGASGRWYYITDVRGSDITVSPGFSLADPNGDNDQADAVVAGNSVSFETIEANGRTFPMAKVNSGDNIYLDGCDYEYPSPGMAALRLNEGAHTFFFMASDGFSTVVDSTDTTGEPDTHIVAKSGPTVSANTAPILTVANPTYSSGAEAVAARSTTTITVPVSVDVTANQWAGRVIEVLQGTGPTVRQIFEIKGNTAATAGNTTVLTVGADAVAAGVVAGTDTFRVGRLLLAPDVGPQGTTFKWRITYTDANNDSPLGLSPATIRLIVDNDVTWSQNNIVRTQVDPSDQNFTDGVVFEFTTSALPSGAHVYHFEANDGASAIRIPATTGVISGPAVNNAPVLSAGSVSPTAGSEVNMYRFEVKYSDSDNDGPDAGYPRLSVWDPSGNLVPGAPFAMTAIDANSFVTGRVYRYDLQTLTAPYLVSGKYTYTFEAASTASGRTQNASLGPNNGPYINRAPTLDDYSVVGSVSLTDTGARSQAYTYTVRYTDPRIDHTDDVGNPPAANNPVLKIYLPASAGGGLVGTYAMTNKAGGNGKYTDGEYYEYTVPAGFFSVAGAYTYTIDARDSVGANYQALDAPQVSGTGPTIDNIPVLSNLTVNPAVGPSGSKFNFSVRYTHPDNTDPTDIRVFIYKPTGGLLIPGGTVLDNNDGGVINGAGRVYDLLPASQITLTQRGTYRFYVRASDGAAPSAFDTVTAPANADTVPNNAVAGPIVTGDPVLSNGTVTPGTGQKDATDFTFSVRYTQAENQPPVAGTLRVFITDPSDVETGYDLTTGVSNPNYAAGVDFTYTTKFSVNGTYKYRFQVPGVSVPLIYFPGPNAADKLTGPTVSNNAPTLTLDSVAPATGRTVTTYVYTVTYTDADGQGPKDAGGNDSKPQLFIDGQPVDLDLIQEADTGDTSVTDGKVYTYTANPLNGPVDTDPGNDVATDGPGLTQGNHTFRWQASDGLNTVQSPLRTGPQVNYIPVLGSPMVNGQPSDVAPTTPVRVNPNGTLTFRVTYSDGDGQVPTYIRCQIYKKDGTPALALNLVAQGPTDANSIRTGVIYQASTTTLALGEYKYYFEATDGTDAVVLNPTAASDANERFGGVIVNTLPVYSNYSAVTVPGDAPGGLPTNHPVTPGTRYKFTCTYTDADGQKPTSATLSPFTTDTFDKLRLYVYEPQAATWVDKGNMDATGGTVTTGRTYSTTIDLDDPAGGGLSGRGVYRWFVVATDGLSGLVGPFGADTNRSSANVGPTVFRVPQLVSPTVTPSSDKAGATFTWSVRYRDDDSQAPTGTPPEVNIQIVDPDGADVYNGPMASSGGSDWFGGVVYTYTRQLSKTGQYKYRLWVTDVGGDTTYFPDKSTWADPMVPEFRMEPATNANREPELPSVTIAPQKGVPGTAFVIRATYRDDDGDPPAGDSPGFPNTLLATILDHNSGQAAQIRLTPDNPANTAYKTGVTYSATWNSTGALADVYTVAVMARDTGASVVWPAPGADISWDVAWAATPDCRITVNNAPTLSNGQLSPGTGAQNTNYIFSVDYRDLDGNNPALVDQRICPAPPAALVAIGVTEPGVYLVLDGPGGMQPKKMPTPAGANFGGTVTYRIQSQATDGTGFGDLAPGSYNFYFIAWDGMDTSRAPVTGTIAGPVVSGGMAPELSDASVLTVATGQPSGYRSDSFIFKVRYRDVDNQAPSELKLYIDGDDVPIATVKTMSGGDILRQDANAYSTGTYYAYTAPAGSLAVGTHTYRWEASDGITAVMLPQLPLPRLSGPTVNNRAPVLSQAGAIPRLNPLSGPSTAEYVYTVRYTDADNDGPTNNAVSLLLDGQTIQMVAKDPSDKNYTDGADFEYRQVGLAAGTTHTYQFNASDGYDSVTWPAAAAVGPAINNPPVLSNPSYTPAKPTAADPVVFTVTYQDPDGDWPSAINVIVHRATAGAKVGSYTMTAAGGTPTTGVTYRASVTGLQLGSYEHYFKASDQWETVVLNPQNDIDPLPVGVTRIPGPVVNTPPTLTLLDVQPRTGPLTTTFTFSAKYADADGQAPFAGDASGVHAGHAGQLLLTVVDPVTGPSTYYMDTTDVTTFQQGRTYTYDLNLANRGLYTFSVSAWDQDPNDAAKGMEYVTATAPAAIGPRVFSLPKLTDQGVTPATGVQGRTFTWSVLYRDADGHAPDVAKPVTIYITDPVTGTTTPHPMTPAAGTPDYVAGVVYTYSEVLNNEGVYQYYYDVTDESGPTEYDREPDAGTNAGPNVTNTPPRFSAVGVNPSSGTPVTSFTWTAIYVDDDDQAPAATYPRVVIIDPTGTPLTNAGGQPYFTMTGSNPADTNYTDGKTYTFTRQLTALGNYSFYFVADDGYVAAPVIHPAAVGNENPALADLSKALVGPSVGTNAPMLTEAKVTDPSNNVSDQTQNNATGYADTTFTYSVKYAHGGNLAPETIQVVIDGVASPMVKKNATEVDFTRPIEYVFSTTLEAGAAHNFYFTATTAGKTARVPESGVITGPTVNNRAPTLTLGGVNPAQGVTTTNFTYTVTYKDLDNQAPQTVQVHLVKPDPANPGQTIETPYTMTRQGTGTPDYTAGVVYQYTTRLSGGIAHSFYFTATDGVAPVQFPQTGRIDGPNVPNTPPILSAGSVTPSSGGSNTVFTFTCIYTDSSTDLSATGDAPAQIRLFIDNDASGKGMALDTRASVPAALKDGNYANGEQYFYQTNSLPLGAHTFSFLASDSRGAGNEWQQETIRLPQTGAYNGPTVSTNNLPTLTNGTVTFPQGTVPTTATFFTYSVTYTDADNNPPARIQIFISENGGATWGAQDLVKKDPTDNVYTDGCIYQLIQRYPPGKPTGEPTLYRYYFEAVDSVELGVVNDPASGRSGPYVGPTVYDNRAPSVTPSGSFSLTRTQQPGGAPMPPDMYRGISPQPVGVPQTFRYPGNYDGGGINFNEDPTYRYSRFQELTFRAVYSDPDNQPPAEMLCVINANPTPMEKENPSDNNYVQGVTYICKVKMDSNFPYRPPNASATLTSPQRGAPGYDTWYTYSFQCNDSNDPASRRAAAGNIFNVNLPPELHGASGGGTGPSDTVWTFRVNYIDNNFPNRPFFDTASGDRPIYVRVIIDGVAHDMEASGGDVDYNQTGFRHPDGAMKPSWVTTTTWPGNDGAQFVYSTKLPIGTHTFYYETTDGWDITRTAEVNGPTVTNSAPVVTTPPSGGLSPATGTRATDFTYTAIYKDVDNQPPSRMVVVIDGTAYSMQKDPTENDYTAGVTYRYTTKLTPGTHTYRFEASDSNNPAANDRFPATQDSTGPIINYPPALANGTVSPASGNTGTTYTYTVDYSDGDGTPPSFIKVFIDGTGFDMVKVDPTQNDFKNPIAYRYQTKLAGGVAHTFYFRTSDGQEETQTTTLSGPNVNAVNNAPTLDAVAVAPQRGGPGTAFTFTATYADQDNDAPTYVRARVFTSDAVAGDPPIATLDMTKVNPTNTAYRAGVAYTATLNTLQGPDIYRFYVEASDAAADVVFPGNADTQVDQRIAGPIVNRLPALTNGQVSPTVGGQLTTYVFTVTYTDPDNTDPAIAKAHDPVPTDLTDPTVPTAAPSLPGIDEDNDGKADPGVFLILADPDRKVTITRMSAASNTFAAGATFQLPLSSLAKGTYTFRYLAWDGIDSARFPGAGVLNGPQVNERNLPTLTNASVSPDPGFKNDAYVYSVTYTDLDGDAPTHLKLWIDQDPSDPASTPITLGAGGISRLDTNPYAQGTVYTYTRAAGTLGLGTHNYVWAASDDGGVNWTQVPANPTARLTGPVVQNQAPTLTGGTVTPATGRTTTEFTYSVIYTDMDDDLPSPVGVNSRRGVQLIVDGVPQDEPMEMAQGEDGKKPSAGIRYEKRISGLTPTDPLAPHTFQFVVSDNTDSTMTQVFTGPTVNTPPVLRPVNAAAPLDTVTPKTANPLAAVRFDIIYQDAEGQLPSTMRVFIHKRTPDNPDMPVGGYTLAPASGGTPTAAQIRAGVRYTVTVTGLPTGAYSHYFVATDALDRCVYPQADSDTVSANRIPAPTMNIAPVLSLATGATAVTPTTGTVDTSYKFQVVYRQDKGVAATYVQLHVDNRAVPYPMVQVSGNAATGAVYECTLTGAELTTTPKPHTFYYHASDGTQEVFLGQSGLDYDVLPSTAVPFTVAVNDKAVLTGATVTALNDSNPSASVRVYPPQTPPTYALTTQRIKYDVIYQDANGDAPQPNQINLYIDGSTTPLIMTPVVAQGVTPDYTAGVLYSYSTTQPLSPGSHSFVMTVFDGSDWSYAHSGTDASALIAAVPPLPPTVDLTKNVAAPPVMTLTNPRVSPNGGGVGTEFEFAVNYVSFLSARQGHVAGCTARALVTKYGSAGAESGGVQMPDVPLTSYVDTANNVTFKGKAKLAELGDYRFQIEVNDGQFKYLTSPINQPKVSKPQLSNLAVSPASGVVGRSFEFTAKYHHEGWQPANRVILHILKDNVEVDPPGTAAGQHPGWPMATTDSNTALLPTTAQGWTYRANVPLTEVGSYGFFVEAYDGPAASNPGADTKPDGGTPQSGPTVTGPGLEPADPPVTPATGGCAGGVFTFAAKYTYGSNTPPQKVNLHLTKVATPPAPEAVHEMVAQTGGDYASGKLFSKTIPITEAGDYTFHFGVVPPGSTQEIMTQPLNGLKLTVEAPALPSLTGAFQDAKVVQEAATGGGRYTYSVIYKQAQNLPPAWVRLFIDWDETKQTAARTVDMVADGGATTYSSGVTYSYTTPDPLPAGQHTYLIKATHGIKVNNETPEYALSGSGPFINQAPTLEAPRVNGETRTLTPARGDENTTYTFSVIYKDPDGQKATSVNVSVGNKSYAMTQADPTKTSPDDYRAGVLYQVQVAPSGTAVSLPAGDLTHSFQASDGSASARLPATGVYVGPKVLQRTDVSLTLSRGSVPLDGVTVVGASGALLPAVPSAAVKVEYIVAVPQPDGTTKNEVRFTRNVTTDTDGNFTAEARPDQDGTWTVRATYDGDVAVGGMRGSGVKEIQFTVSPAQNNYPASLYMIGLPVTPTWTDLKRTFQGAAFDAALYAGKTGDQVNWLKYTEGTFPTPRPGMGFWLFTTGTVNAQASGRIVNHDAEFAIPVRAGWQQIANPYLQSTQWANARFSSGGARMTLAEARTQRLIYDHAWVYDGVRSEMRLLHATAEGADRFLQPWQGAWFYSRVAGELILAKPSDSRVAESDRSERRRNRADETGWSIGLRASNGQQSSGINYAGVAGDSGAAELAYLEKPPVMPKYVDLYFEGPGDGRHYATDYRAAIAGEQVWNFTVATDIADKAITVSAPDLSRVPKHLEVLLEDVDAGGKRVYLRTAAGYTFSPGAGGARHMRLIVRPRTEGALRVVETTFRATRGGRSIGVVLSQDALVTIEILSPSGQRLAVVADSQPTTNRRAQFVWDESRADGARLPSGLYLAQVTAKQPDGPACRSVRPVVMTR